ncbi:MAG: sugar phosphate nucleotidyltransferase [Cyclobacteriaceae bacterium]
MTLLILAAGSGSRYGGSKQFDGIGPKGEYLLEYNLYDAIAAGFKDIIVVCKEGQEVELTDYFHERLPEEISFSSVGQSIEDIPEGCRFPGDRQKRWGTAHAVWSSRNHINGKFVTVNADDYYGRSSFQTTISAQLPADYFGMIGFQLKQTLSKSGTVSRGVCEVAADELVRVEEFTAISHEGDSYSDKPTGTIFTGNELVSMNMWMLDDSIFPMIENQFRKFLSDKSQSINAELYLPSIVQDAISQGLKNVKTFESQEKWMGLTFKGDRSEVSADLSEFTKKGVYPSPLWK